MNLSKFQFAYEKHGIIGFINVLLSKLGIKYRLENQLKKQQINGIYFNQPPTN